MLKKYYSILIGSRDMNFIMSSYLEVQFRETPMQCLLMQIEIFSSACIFTIEFVESTKEECQN